MKVAMVKPLLAAVGTVVVLAGVVTVKAGAWLLSIDPTDLHDGCDCAWETSTNDGGDNVHVIPIHDEIHHTETDGCPCGPRTEPVFRPDGSNGWVHTHHSLDNREAHE